MISPAGSDFSGFKKDSGAVVNLEAGAIATFSDSGFEGNEAESAGPLAALKSEGTSGAAVWFHGCDFGGDTNVASNPGEVSVESRECRVYSNTFKPTVWELELGRELNPWLLAPREDASVGAQDVFEGVAFPTERDGFFTNVVVEQATATGLPEVTPEPLPEGSAFITRDPYSGTGSRTFWSGRNIALVVGLGGTFIVLAIGVLIWYFCYFKPDGETEPFSVRSSCSSHFISPSRSPWRDACIETGTVANTACYAMFGECVAVCRTQSTSCITQTQLSPRCMHHSTVRTRARASRAPGERRLAMTACPT